MASVLIACGADEDHSGNGGNAQGQGGASAPTKLADHTAGTACSNAKDCSGGTCAQSLPNNALPGQGDVQAPGGYCTLGCTLNADCGAGGICLGANNTNSQGMCMERCVASSQCRDGYRCVDTNNQVLDGDADQPIPDTSTGSCQVSPATDKLTNDKVGAMCSSDDDCSGGRCAKSDMIARIYPDGYCSGRCSQDADCGDNGVCTPGLPGVTGTCYRKCASDADCGRDGYRCRMNVTGTGLQCQPGVKPLRDNTTGRACSGDADCGGNAMSCATSSGGRNATPYPGGYCTQACVDSSDCGAGGVCAANYALIAMGNCYRSCTASSACRDGYVCRTLTPQGALMAMAATAQPTVCTLPGAMQNDQDAGM